MSTQAQHRSKRLKTYTTCKRCGKVKPKPKGNVSTAREVASDPYCSADCCRLDHGLSNSAVQDHPKGEQPHGESRYQAGCRCDICRDGSAERRRKTRAKAKKASS